MAQDNSGAPPAPPSDSLGPTSSSRNDIDPSTQGQQSLAVPEYRISDDGREWVCLQHEALDVAAVMARVKDPAVGAVVLFVGTTRDNFGGEKVERLSYSAYTSLALKTMASIAADIRQRHELHGIAIVHRLGDVPVTVESIVVAIGASHRTAAWRAGEECLEAVKARAEIWKKEMFTEVKPGAGLDVEADGGVWRANAQTDGHGNTLVRAQEEGASEEADAADHVQTQKKEREEWPTPQPQHPATLEIRDPKGTDSRHEQHEQHEQNEQHQQHEQHESHEESILHDDERRRIADEAQRQMQLEFERGWGDT